MTALRFDGKKHGWESQLAGNMQVMQVSPKAQTKAKPFLSFMRIQGMFFLFPNLR